MQILPTKKQKENCSGCYSKGLAHSFPVHPFSTPKEHQKSLRFPDVFRGREKLHWERRFKESKWGTRCKSMLKQPWKTIRIPYSELASQDFISCWKYK